MAVPDYRAQQGLKGFGSVDPIVVEWTKRAAAATGADPVALLATALQESGAQRGRTGDVASGYASHGPWQMRETVGALGNRSVAWANSYAAALNRAKEFSRLKVHGGKGAAAIQRPADAAGYARSVDSLLDKARAILGASAPVRAGVTPSSPRANPVVAAASDAPSSAQRAALLEGLLSDAPGDTLASLMQQAGGQGAPAPAVVSSPGPGALKPRKPSAPGVELKPGGGWGGSRALATSLADIGKRNGLRATSEKRSRRNTKSGGMSDHYSGNANAYAYDLSNGSSPTPQMDKAAAEIAAALGVPGWKGGVLNVTKGGYRYQVLYRTQVGGNHDDHVHVGVRKV